MTYSPEKNGKKSFFFVIFRDKSSASTLINWELVSFFNEIPSFAILKHVLITNRDKETTAIINELALQIVANHCRLQQIAAFRNGEISVISLGNWELRLQINETHSSMHKSLNFLGTN